MARSFSIVFMDFDISTESHRSLLLDLNRHWNRIAILNFPIFQKQSNLQKNWAKWKNIVGFLNPETEAWTIRYYRGENWVKNFQLKGRWRTESSSQSVLYYVLRRVCEWPKVPNFFPFLQILMNFRRCFAIQIYYYYCMMIRIILQIKNRKMLWWTSEAIKNIIWK